MGGAGNDFPANAAEFFAGIAGMTDAEAVAGAATVNTMAIWETTECRKITTLDGAMKMVAFAFDALEAEQDREELRQACGDLVRNNDGAPGVAGGGGAQHYTPTPEEMRQFVSALCEA